MSRPYNDGTYQRNRRKALERDGWTCRICGKDWTQVGGKRNITAQHIIPIAMGGGHEVSNLVALCRKCHGSQDGGRRYRPRTKPKRWRPGER